MAGQPGSFYEGRPVMVRIISISADDSDPIELREGLVGVAVRTIFDHDQLCKIGKFGDAVPEGARSAYAGDVAEALREADRDVAADKMMEAVEGDPLALYIILAENHETL
jgi:hypothetical protein